MVPGYRKFCTDEEVFDTIFYRLRTPILNNFLTKELDRLGQYTRRSNIVMRNVFLPEKESNEELTEKIIKIIKTDLKLQMQSKTSINYIEMARLSKKMAVRIPKTLSLNLNRTPRDTQSLAKRKIFGT